MIFGLLGSEIAGTWLCVAWIVTERRFSSAPSLYLFCGS